MATQTSEKQSKRKLPAGITEEFVEVVEREGSEALKSMIVNMQAQLEDAQRFLKENEQVLELKAAYEEAAAPSRETVKVLRARTKFVVEALKKSGVL